MKIKHSWGNWLQQSAEQLKKQGIASAQLDALILLEDVLGQDRAYILAHLDKTLTHKQFVQLSRNLKKRLNSEPLAYIRGFCEFYGRRFTVNKDVLIPRPESEAFINLLKTLAHKPEQSLLDVGSGSGILAITAKLELPSLQVTANDISKKALKIATANAKALKANVKFLRTDLINKSLNQYNFILANLPYIPLGYPVSPSVKHEPTQALYSGKDGLTLIGLFIPTAYKTLKENGYLLLESLPKQQKPIKTLCKAAGFKFVCKDGLVQCFQKP